MELLRASHKIVSNKFKTAKEVLFQNPVGRIAVAAALTMPKALNFAFVASTGVIIKISEQFPNSDWQALSIYAMALSTLAASGAEYYALKKKGVCMNTNTDISKILSNSNVFSIILSKGLGFFGALNPTNFSDFGFLSYSAATGDAKLFLLYMATRTVINSAYNASMDLLIGQGKIEEIYKKICRKF